MPSKAELESENAALRKELEEMKKRSRDQKEGDDSEDGENELKKRKKGDDSSNAQQAHTNANGTVVGGGGGDAGDAKTSGAAAAGGPGLDATQLMSHELVLALQALRSKNTQWSGLSLLTHTCVSVESGVGDVSASVFVHGIAGPLDCVQIPSRGALGSAAGILPCSSAGLRIGANRTEHCFRWILL